LRLNNKLLKFKNCILYTILLLVNITHAYAQPLIRYNSFNYSVNEGLLQSSIVDIAFDKNNFCWISYPNGIQKFDGKSFTAITIQSGLPDDKLVNLFTTSKGVLLLSHSQGISKYNINRNNFTQIFLNKKTETTAARFIGEVENILYVCTENGNIVGIDCNNFEVISTSSSGLSTNTKETNYYINTSSNIINGKVAFLVKNTVYIWDFKKQVFIYKKTLPEVVSFLFLYLISENEIIYASALGKNNLKKYSFANNSISIYLKSLNEGKSAWRSILSTWSNNTVLSVYNKLYILNADGKTVKSEIVNYQNNPIGGNNSAIAKIKEDNYGNLYLVTIMDGIKKIIKNNHPIKYYGTSSKEDNFVVSVLPDKINNRILAGTLGSGLLIFDTMQRFIKCIKNLPGQTAPFCTNSIVKNNNGEYLLYVVGQECIWKLSANLEKLTSIKINKTQDSIYAGISYFGNVIYQNNVDVVYQSQNNIFKFNFKTNTFASQTITNGHPMSGMLYKNMIVTHANDELYFLDKNSFAEIRRVAFKNTGYVRCFAKPNLYSSGKDTNNIYVGSNKGIFVIDSTGKILSHLTKETGLPDECIYAMVFDEEGFLWCSTNKGIFKLNKDNSVLQLKKEDGLQENEFNTNVVAKSEDGEVFFGGVNGISSFYPNAINSFNEKINLLVTQIKVNNKIAFADTSVENMTNIKLPYDQNLLSFDFIAMGNNNPDQYIYQYKMDGIDKEWLVNNDLQTVRYFLPPGKYIFKIYASRLFDKDAKPLKEIIIIIHPPFYKSWWFLTGMFLLFTSLLGFGIGYYNKTKYKKRIADIENEYKIQVERERISRDLHDSIGAYANAVLYKTELLENEINAAERIDLMSDLKFASKDIITSLRETVWALKKEIYTGEECLVRIKNFIQPLARYYSNINFKVEGDAPADTSFHYTKALNLVRIVQEAVSNSIKHANADNIIVTSGIENSKWKLTVHDDGKGFDYEAAKILGTGNGLHNMQQRAIDAGFYFTIETAVDGNTLITILV
jgi:ligand-binding sensor domain-containing protein